MFILVMNMVFPSDLLILDCTSAFHSSVGPETPPTLYMSGTQLHTRDSEGNRISTLWSGVHTTQCLQDLCMWLYQGSQPLMNTSVDTLLMSRPLGDSLHMKEDAGEFLFSLSLMKAGILGVHCHTGLKRCSEPLSGGSPPPPSDISISFLWLL